MRGAVAAWLLTAACGRVDYDRQVTDDGGGNGLPDARFDARPGADAGSICPGQEPCTVADSESEFSDTQGRDGWWYGHWAASADGDGSYQAATDFAAMIFTSEATWQPQPAPNPEWCYLAPYWGHPDGDPMDLPIRRWVSEVAGAATITVTHRKGDGGGDGTRAILYCDGVMVWTRDVAGDDFTGVTEDVPCDLQVGSTVDLILHPIAEDAVDTTQNMVTIHSRP